MSPTPEQIEHLKAKAADPGFARAVVEREALQALLDFHEAHASGGEWWIGRADGELMAGEYVWSAGGKGPDPDWMPAGEEWHDDPTEYVARRMVQAEERRRTFGEAEVDDDEDDAR